ncbi:MAG: hypothetical protein EXS05_18010 [Planctomycetaceae bacterium]|nr:hypothetical protein [Planctomycetaceae bacterium]
MERALAAIHQANRDGLPISLEYGTQSGRVGLFLRFAEPIRELVTGPIVANYPNCSIVSAKSEEGSTDAGSAWYADLLLTPEIFPILRHAQFEDLLNGTFADPITNILRANRVDSELNCRVEITIAPASPRRRRTATRATQRLNREFFRHHHELAHYYAAHITRRRTWLLAWLLGVIARGTPAAHRTALDTSSSRAHDREEDLQAASEKIGGHLFETHIRLIVQGPQNRERDALDRLHQMAGAFGSFTKSRLAMFHIGRIYRGVPRPFQEGFLLSHEEVATLFHPPCASVDAEGMERSEFTELEPPAMFRSGTEEGSVLLGLVRFREDRRQVAIGGDDRRQYPAQRDGDRRRNDPGRRVDHHGRDDAQPRAVALGRPGQLEPLRRP